MDLNTFGNLLSFGEVPDAEPVPGLYAWYLRIRLGKNNIKSPENFSRALNRITEQICYPALTMQLQGHLNLNLKGKLRHIWYGHDDNPFSNSFKETLNHPEERKILSDILDLAVPLLTGPLYIGVSKNLRVRLRQHVRLIQGSDTARSIDSEESFENDKSFAERIKARKIDPNHLVVSVVDVSHPDISSKRIRKTVGTAETLLNRMFYPVLGRR